MASKIDIAGLLTGIPTAPQKVDPRLNMQQQQLAFGQQAADMMSGGIRGLMTGQAQTTPYERASQAERLQATMSQLDPSNPDDLRALIRILAATDPAGAIQAMQRLKDLEKTSYSKGSTFTVTDEDENQFIAVPVTSSTGETTINYQPVGEGPAKPQGKTTITGGEFALTPQQETERKAGSKGAETVAKDFGKLKVEAGAKLPGIREELNRLQNSLTLLKKVPTGGPINLAKYGVQEFFGLTGGDKARLERQMAMSILESLKPLFGGLISEGERKALEQISANVRRGNKANTAIIETMLDRLEGIAANALMYTNSDSQEEYESLVKDMYKPEEEAKVSWENLDGVNP